MDYCSRHPATERASSGDHGRISYLHATAVAYENQYTQRRESRGPLRPLTNGDFLLLWVYFVGVR
jgi:hypothetical protein